MKTATSRRSASSRFSVERLESREMMAGDLSAALVNGNLVITGGAVSNGVQISTSSSGAVQLVGLTAGGVATKINHQSGPLSFNVAHDIRLDLGGNDDIVRVQGVHVLGNLLIDTGDGSDSITINDSHVNRALTINGGTGNDTITLARDLVGGRLSTDLGDGDDYFSLIGGTLKGNFDLKTGHNADRVVLQDVSVDYAMSIVGEAPYASEQISLTNVSIRLGLSIQTGDGRDKVLLTGVSADTIDINTGAGNDTVVLDHMNANALNVLLGDGNDQLTVGNSSAKRAHFDGGVGTNHYSQPAANSFAVVSRDRFTS